MNENPDLFLYGLDYSKTAINLVKVLRFALERTRADVLRPDPPIVRRSEMLRFGLGPILSRRTASGH